jgi:peptidoglycan/xylan/chitin deacetylase (PgdA/CDA1 family)
MKRIALTFDDGPNVRYTLKVLQILIRYNIKACFFLLAKNVERLPDIAKRIKREGHLIGNHTYEHRHLTRLNSQHIRQEIEKAEAVFKDILGIRPKFFRPPYGKYNRKIKDIARTKGLKLIDWDCCADDWEGPGPEVITKRIVSQVKSGSIILLHDGANIRIGESRLNTMKALGDIIRILKGRGYRFVRLDTLLKWQR